MTFSEPMLPTIASPECRPTPSPRPAMLSPPSSPRGWEKRRLSLSEAGRRGGGGGGGGGFDFEGFFFRSLPDGPLAGGRPPPQPGARHAFAAFFAQRMEDALHF